MGSVLRSTEAAALAVSRIDKQLHAERTVSGGGKATYRTELSNVPDGALIANDGSAWLVWQGGLFRWSADGHTKAEAPPAPTDAVTVLTPTSITALFRAGFTPQVHASVRR